MGNYGLSRRADAEVAAIAEDSGLARAERHIMALHGTFSLLAEFPDLGRGAGHVRAGYRKIDSGSHSVFYQKTDGGVLIVRVLHQRMDFDRHL